MMDFLLKLFGIPATQSGRLAGADVSFHGSINPFWLLLIAIVLAALVYWMYRKTSDHVSLFRRLLLTTLRSLFLLLILGILANPVWTITFEHAVRRTVLMLFDSSASMAEIKDQRSDEDDLKRVAIARGTIDPEKGLKAPLPSSATGLANASRLEVSKAAFANSKLNLMGRISQDFDLLGFTFGRELAEVPDAAYHARLEEQETAEKNGQPLPPPPALNTAWIQKIQGTAPLSAVGQAVQDVINRKRGQMLAGVVLVTDGASNSGINPADAAAFAQRNRVPLFIYGVGITAPKDIIVANVLAPEVAFAKDQVNVSVLVRWMGMERQSGKLVVTLGDERTEQEVAFDTASGERAVTVSLTPKTKGEFKLTAAITPRDDEVVKDNNSAQQSIRVVDDKIKVLFVEQYPRWEYKYVQAILMRDRRIDAKFLLLEGDASISRGQSTPYLSEFPKKREELEKFDVIVLGDVDPKRLQPQDLDNLKTFVSDIGGGMIMLAGRRFAPNAYRRSPIENLLPVDMESVDLGLGGVANKPVRLELTPAGRASPMLRLAERELDSVSRWSALPPIYWTAKVARAKPAAEVLLVDPDPSKASRFGKMPVIALQQHGAGQVLYVGTDNLWRIRRNAGDRFHAALWGQMVVRMALPHLLGGAKRTQLKTDAQTYQTGQRVSLYARLYTESFEPMKEPAVKALMTLKDSTVPPREIVLRPDPGIPGMYRGETIAPQAGRYSLSVPHEKDPNHVRDITVEEPKIELADAAMNLPVLQQMATVSGGAFFREEDLNKLPEQLTGKQERVKTRYEVELWSTPIYYVLLLGLVAMEWVVRKMSQLK